MRLKTNNTVVYGKTFLAHVISSSLRNTNYPHQCTHQQCFIFASLIQVLSIRSVNVLKFEDGKLDRIRRLAVFALV